MQATPAQCQLGQLSTPTPEFTLLLQTCTYTRTHISISIIYTCGIRTADERDLGLKLCKQQQLLPIPTTTKGRRSPEVRWVPGNWRARNNQRVRKQEEQKPSPCRGGAEGAQALLRQTEGNHKQDGQEHAGLARAGQRHVVTRVRQRTRDMPPQEEGLGQGSALCRAELEAGILECDLGGSPEYAPLHVVLKHFPQLFPSPKLPFLYSAIAGSASAARGASGVPLPSQTCRDPSLTHHHYSGCTGAPWPRERGAFPSASFAQAGEAPGGIQILPTLLPGE